MLAAAAPAIAAVTVDWEEGSGRGSGASIGILSQGQLGTVVARSIASSPKGGMVEANAGCCRDGAAGVGDNRDRGVGSSAFSRRNKYVDNSSSMGVKLEPCVHASAGVVGTGVQLGKGSRPPPSAATARGSAATTVAVELAPLSPLPPPAATTAAAPLSPLPPPAATATAAAAALSPPPPPAATAAAAAARRAPAAAAAATPFAVPQAANADAALPVTSARVTVAPAVATADVMPSAETIPATRAIAPAAAAALKPATRAVAAAAVVSTAAEAEVEEGAACNAPCGIVPPANRPGPQGAGSQLQLQLNHAPLAKGVKEEYPLPERLQAVQLPAAPAGAAAGGRFTAGAATAAEHITNGLKGGLRREHGNIRRPSREAERVAPNGPAVLRGGGAGSLTLAPTAGGTYPPGGKRKKRSADNGVAGAGKQQSGRGKFDCTIKEEPGATAAEPAGKSPTAASHGQPTHCMIAAPGAPVALGAGEAVEGVVGEGPARSLGVEDTTAPAPAAAVASNSVGVLAQVKSAAAGAAVGILRKGADSNGQGRGADERGRGQGDWEQDSKAMAGAAARCSDVIVISSDDEEEGEGSKHQQYQGLHWKEAGIGGGGKAASSGMGSAGIRRVRRFRSAASDQVLAEVAVATRTAGVVAKGVGAADAKGPHTGTVPAVVAVRLDHHGAAAAVGNGVTAPATIATAAAYGGVETVNVEAAVSAPTGAGATVGAGTGGSHKAPNQYILKVTTDVEEAAEQVLELCRELKVQGVLSVKHIVGCYNWYCRCISCICLSLTVTRRTLASALLSLACTRLPYGDPSCAFSMDVCGTSFCVPEVPYGKKYEVARQPWSAADT